jgi:hypothetical protein
MENRGAGRTLFAYIVPEGVLMSKLFAIAVIVVAASLAATTTADARGGCGLGRHHGPLGICVDNVAGPAVVVAPRGAVVVAPTGRVCPLGWHLGPYGHCRRN